MLAEATVIIAGLLLTGLWLAFAAFLRQADRRVYPRQSTYQVLDLGTGKLRSQSLSAPATCSVTVVIPAYKEQDRIGPMLSDTIQYLEARAPGKPAEIIVVDDGSPDETVQRVKDVYAFKRPLNVSVGLIRLPKNQGKGAAISEGILAARGEAILFADADGATNISELAKMETVGRRLGGLVCGSRRTGDTKCQVKRSPLRAMLMRAFNIFLGFFGVRSVKDTQCGFKLLSREAARRILPNLRLDRWIFDVELIYLAERAGLSVTEVPINWQEVDGSKLNLAVDSVRMAVDLVFMRAAYALHIWPIHATA